MSNAAPTNAPNKTPCAWFCLAGAAFWRVGLGLAEVGPVSAGAALTQLVVVTTTTPPSSFVEVKVDVTGLEVVNDGEVGLLVIEFEVPGKWSVFGMELCRRRNSNPSSNCRRRHL